MFFLNSFLDIPLFTFPLTPDSVRRHIQGPSKTMPKRTSVTSDAMSPNRRYEIWDPYWREIIVSGTAAITTFSSSWPSFSCSCVSNWNVNSYVTLSFISVIKSNNYRTLVQFKKLLETSSASDTGIQSVGIPHASHKITICLPSELRLRLQGDAPPALVAHLSKTFKLLGFTKWNRS